MLQRHAQLALQLQHIVRGLLHRCVEQLEARAAEVLRAVHRGVGIAQDFVGQVMAVVADRNADARREYKFGFAQREGLGHRGEDALRDLHSGRRERHVFQQDRELVAGQPCDHVLVAHAGEQPARDFLQDGVADEMAEVVADDLEAVHVHEQQRAASFEVAPDEAEHAFEAIAQIAAIGQAS